MKGDKTIQDAHEDIDATDDLENAMVDAARCLVIDYGYSMSDLLNLLESTIEFGP